MDICSSEYQLNCKYKPPGAHSAHQISTTLDLFRTKTSKITASENTITFCKKCCTCLWVREALIATKRVVLRQNHMLEISSVRTDVKLVLHHCPHFVTSFHCPLSIFICTTLYNLISSLNQYAQSHWWLSWVITPVARHYNVWIFHQPCSLLRIMGVIGH